MTTTTIHANVHPRATEHPVIRSRKLAAGILSAVVAVFSIAFVALFGAFGAFVLAVTLPMPMIFLWAGCDALRSDEG